MRHQDKGTQSQRGSKNRAEEEPGLMKNWPNKAKFGRILCGGHGLRGGESQIGLGGLQSSRLLNSDSTTATYGLGGVECTTLSPGLISMNFCSSGGHF